MLTAGQHIQREWLNARCHILEIAAILDRIDAAGGADDPTVGRIRELIRIVQQPAEPGQRAREILTRLSD